MIELLLEAETALSLGLLDRAEILYRQVAGADPRNSIALVGLARVMLERGDEQGALKQARRALAIDAENTAAQRMVERLEEVLAYRAGTEGRPAPSAPVASSPVAAASPIVAVPAAAPPEPPATPTDPGQSSDAGTQRATEARESTEVPSPSPSAKVPPSRSLVDRLLRRR